MADGVVVLVTRQGLGHVAPADEPFGTQMLERFLHTLEGRPAKVRAICFYTEGVKAACHGSPSVIGLKLLEGMGVRLVVCRTCLDYYGLTSRLAVGEIGGMDDIVALLTDAHHVLTV